MADLMGSLNERQREAVLETEGYVRVIAGAGSGKTKLLVSRYAYLVQDYGIDSANILCVTFTNKAAGEMKKRIRALIGEDNDVSLICTYHGFCNRLLRENPEKLFLDRQFQIIDSHQQKVVLGEIYQKYELKMDYASFESILKKLGAVKKDTEYVPRLCNPVPCQILKEIKDQDDRIMEEFLQRQKATYSLDFHDLICFAIYLLETDEGIREKWQDRLNYIMVDEFQDSSSVEMRLVEILSGKYQNMMIVGDPDQNIYEWRGSDVRLLVDFDKDHDPTRTIILNQNYRSTPQILQCANALIEKNELRLKKDLFTRNEAGAPVFHYHSKDEIQEMEAVVQNIKHLRAREGMRYSDFAIIYRASFLSRMAEKKLVEKNIPYEIFGGVRFYQRMEILDVLAYLKLIAYDDDLSFRRVANTPSRRFGRAKMNYLEAVRNGSHRTLFAALEEHLEDKIFQNSDIASFVQLIQSLRTKCGQKRISEIVNQVTRDSGYEAYIRELGDEERLENLAEFKRIANEFEREFGENLSLDEFLQQIALQSGEERDEAKDTVKLMTIHSSKGLEFPVVFVLGFSEGIFPSAKTLGERKKLGLEEERRLCYVAITRAEKHLFLMESEGSTPGGIKKLVSRFLEEIGENNYTRIGRISEDLKQESRGYAAKLDREIQMERPAVRKAGDQVEHHIFGKGTILSVDAKRGSYSIQFEKVKLPRNISAGYFSQEHSAPPLQREGGPQEGAVAEPQPQKQEPSGVGPKVEEAPSSVTPEGEEGEEKALSGRTPEAKKGHLSGETPGTERNKPDRTDLPATTPAWKEEEPSGSEAGEKTQEYKPDESEQEEYEAARLRALKENSPNLWKRQSVPHQGWTCVGVEDLGAPVGICQMCGYQIIRYAHQMEHPQYAGLSVGCVCAGRMEGDVAGAKRREAEFKNRQARRVNFFKRQWKHSQKGNEYLKIDGHVAVLYHPARAGNVWKYSIDNEFCKAVYPTRERALAGVFDRLEQLKGRK